MTKAEWSALYIEDQNTYRNAYLDFMFNRHNIRKCNECPENIGHNGHEACGNPCGQQNCWVVCHFKTFAGAFDKYVQILIATNNGDPKRLQTAYRNTKIRQVVK